MSKPTMEQVVSYIPRALRKRMDQEIAKSPTRISISRYIESVLRQHLNGKNNAA